jgi:hypothetical protein
MTSGEHSDVVAPFTAYIHYFFSDAGKRTGKTRRKELKGLT